MIVVRKRNANGGLKDGNAKCLESAKRGSGNANGRHDDCRRHRRGGMPVDGIGDTANDHPAVNVHLESRVERTRRYDQTSLLRTENDERTSAVYMES